MELYAVAGRVGDERLKARARSHWVGHLQPLASELGHQGRNIAERQCEVLPQVVRWLGFDEMDLLAAGVQPCAPEAEVGPVGAYLQAENVDVESERGVDVIDVDRHVVQTYESHLVDYGTEPRGRWNWSAGDCLRRQRGGRSSGPATSATAGAGRGCPAPPNEKSVAPERLAPL
jgi:hypothetical protein